MWTIPNMLTMFRALAVLPVVALILAGAWAPALALFIAAAATDWLDGWLARRWNQTSEFGRFLDPIADKLMVAAALVALLDARVIAGAAATWAVVLILLRELLVAGLREYLGPRRVVVHVSGLAKWKTALQLLAVAALLAAAAWPGAAWVAPAALGLLWAAAALTVLTGAQYLAGGLAHMRGP